MIGNINTESRDFVIFSALKIVGVFSVLMFIVRTQSGWNEVSAAIQDRRGPTESDRSVCFNPLPTPSRHC